MVDHPYILGKFFTPNNISRLLFYWKSNHFLITSQNIWKKKQKFNTTDLLSTFFFVWLRFILEPVQSLCKIALRIEINIIMSYNHIKKHESDNQFCVCAMVTQWWWWWFCLLIFFCFVCTYCHHHWHFIGISHFLTIKAVDNLARSTRSIWNTGFDYYCYY